MSSLICDDIEDDTAVAVQRDLIALNVTLQLSSSEIHTILFTTTKGSRLRIIGGLGGSIRGLGGSIGGLHGSIWGLGGSIGGLTGIGGLEDYGDSGVF